MGRRRNPCPAPLGLWCARQRGLPKATASQVRERRKQVAWSPDFLLYKRRSGAKKSTPSAAATSIVATTSATLTNRLGNARTQASASLHASLAVRRLSHAPAPTQASVATIKIGW